MANNPNDVRLTVLMKLQEAIDEEAILEEQILALMHRFADRFTDRRVEINNLMVLHDHPLVDYGKYALGCMTEADMKKCVYLKSVRDELLRSMEEKRQLMTNDRDIVESMENGPFDYDSAVHISLKVKCKYLFVLEAGSFTIRIFKISGFCIHRSESRRMMLPMRIRAMLGEMEGTSRMLSGESFALPRLGPERFIAEYLEDTFFDSTDKDTTENDSTEKNITDEDTMDECYSLKSKGKYVPVSKKLSQKVSFKSPIPIKGCVLRLANIQTWDDIVKKIGIRKPNNCADKGKGKMKV
ncbi:hypothetical protein Tco_0060185 [Tanacetum coccineum]